MSTKRHYSNEPNPPGLDDRDLAEARASISIWTNDLRASIERATEPSPRSRAALSRFLVELVRQDVRDRLAAQSLRRKARDWWRGFTRTWGSLAEGSFSFRLLQTGTLAAGVALVLAFVALEIGDGAARAAKAKPVPAESRLPVLVVADPDPSMEPRNAAEAWRRAIEMPDRSVPVRRR